VQRYVQVLGEIEAAQKFIAVSADMKLLDGKHRWLAYRKRNGDQEQDISVLVYPVNTPHECLKLAAKLNSCHGWQLADSDKEAVAKTLYAYGATYEDIAATLSVGKKKVGEWLARTVKENKDKRDAKIFDLWMQCHTQEKIAEAAGITQQAASKITDGFTTSVLENQSCKAAASHATNFKAPIYNIWKQQEKTPGSSHFGNSEITWLDNLLYLYTDPFDVVVDPFGGGGSTIDLCKKRFRRYFVSDRKPIVEREKEIRLWDIVNGIPPLHRWQDARLVYLDPPYWKQAEGKYSDSPEDLANMTLDKFNESLSGLVNSFGKKLPAGAHIALIISPTQYPAPNKEFTDHVGDMLRAVKLPVDMRYSVPYESQQYNGNMVNWAKDNKKCLVLTREIIVWRIV
jgi:DNA-binding XRE family transcriptional regulator